MAGFIVIDRKIQDWKWWGNTNAMSIWLYLLVGANWKDGYWHGIEVKRGSLITSKVKMAEMLRMNRRTIDHWLKVFAEEGQITYQCTSNYTAITIENYDKYQCLDTDTAQVTAQPTTQPSAQPTAHNRTRITTITNNNTNSCGRMKKPTIEEVRSYIEEKGYNVDPERFYDFYESNGWKVGKNPMKDWKACVRTWQKNNNGKPQRGGSVRIETPDWYKRQQQQGYTEQVASDELQRQFEEMKKGFEQK